MGALLRSRRYWAAVLCLVGCLAATVALQNVFLFASVLFLGLLVAAAKWKSDRPVAAGLGCAVLASIVVIVVGSIVVLALYISSGTYL